MIVELMPCPFCGGEAHVIDENALFEGIAFVVGCDTPECHANVTCGRMYDSPEKAVENWNKRAVNRVKAYVNHGDHGPEPRFPGDAWTMWYCCPVCDNPVTEGDRYCKTCGTELDWPDNA